MTPTAAQVAELLDAAGWSAYRAAKLLGVDARTIQRARTGERDLSAPTWRLLQILASQTAREALPPAPLP